MKITLICVGYPRGPLAEAIQLYEKRLSRYFGIEVIEVKEAAYRRQPLDQLIAEEGERLLARIPDSAEVIALHRPGTPWSSERLADHLREAALRGVSGVAFVVGGAYGLSPGLLNRADRAISLSAMTLPHELARLVLTEQLYRAGTIIRGEPYHKGKGF